MQRIVSLLVLSIVLPTTISAQTNSCDATSLELYISATVEWYAGTPCVTYSPQEPALKDCYDWSFGEVQPGCEECLSCRALDVEVERSKSAKVFFLFAEANELRGFQTGVCNATDTWDRLAVFDFIPSEEGLSITYPVPLDSDRCTDFGFCFEHNGTRVCGGDPTLATKSPINP